MNTRYKVTKLGDGSRYMRTIVDGKEVLGCMFSHDVWHEMMLPLLRVKCTLIGETWEEDKRDD